ncbi:ubiquitin-protein transferase [Aureococcus anophagefferens]|uniref:Ubiquitin-protein transferase n=2 Tax=Aureococcus anophagefferens TaxID=44056 RepID=A0ABR1GCR7_AURAN
MGAGQVTAIHIEDRSGRYGVVPPPLAEPIAGPPPASRAAIRRVPLVRVQADDLRKDSNEACCVCLEPHEVGSVAARLPCGHLFHEQCVTEWLTRHCSCPVCRFELATDDAAFERGRERRSRLEGRRVRVRRSEVERMSVRALKDIIGAVGMTTRGCFERGDLVKRVLESSSVDVVPETVHEMTRAELDAMTVGEIARTAKRLGVIMTTALERDDVVDLLVGSGRVLVVEDGRDAAADGPRAEAASSEAASSGASPAAASADSSPAAVTLTEESKEEAGDDDAPSPKRTRPKESGFKRGFLNAPPSEKKKKPPPADDS